MKLVAHFHAAGVLDFWMLMATGMMATAIFLLVVFGPPAGKQTPAFSHRLARYVLASSFGVLALRVWAGWFETPVEPANVVILGLALWVIWRCRGDVSVLLTAVRHARGDARESGPT